MASKEYMRLMAAGFSERFLRTTAGNHPAIRAAIAKHPASWRNCGHCYGKYADVSEIPTPVLNKQARDIREPNAAHKVGFCSFSCAAEKFNTTESGVRHMIYAARLAARKDFYETRQWRELRYEVLAEQGARCQCCGRSRADGVVLHVDHIKPRFRYPFLALTKSNLQVLCADCNLGKGFSDSTDWRDAG